MSNDSNFGCWIWENDFDNLTSNNKIREQIKQSLLQSINRFELRITNVRVDVMIRQEELLMNLTGRQMKKMMEITVSAFLLATKEPITYTDRFFTGPLSY